MSGFSRILSFIRVTSLCCLYLHILGEKLYAEQLDSVPGEYIVKFSTKNPTMRANMLFNLGVSVQSTNSLTDIHIVQSLNAKSVDNNYAKDLLASGLIEYIEPNYLYTIENTPNDSDYDSLWGMHNIGQTGGSADIDIDAPEAWDINTGSTDVVVGIVDTGIDYNHPDLAANIWTNPNEIPGNGVDDDGNGVIDDIHGYNAVNNSGDPLDDNNHGTHCAGTIGGVGNNSSGVSGVNWQVKMMGLKFLNGSGSGSTSDAIETINYAVTMRNRGVNIKVLSNSWGGGGYSQALADAISAANQAGILFVAAAGNSARDNDTVSNYPSNYEIDNVLAVAAVDHNGNLASFSNYGATTVDLAAPGVSILSTTVGGGYSSFSGTSMATPHVSGVAALLLANEPSLSTAQVKSRLQNTVQPISSLNSLMAYPGIVNAYSALTNSEAPLPPPPPAFNYEKAPIEINYDTNLGTKVLEADDAYYTADLAFSFNYYGANFSRIHISTNGRIIPLADGATGTTSPDYNNYLTQGIHPYHDDLFPSPYLGAGTERGVYLKSDASSATVTWLARNYSERASTNPTADLVIQAKIFSNGQIEFHYPDTLVGKSSLDYGASASIGLAKVTGTNGEILEISHNTANQDEVSNGKALQTSFADTLPANDFDGDGKSDMVVFRPTSATWYILTSNNDFDFSEHQSYQFGLPGDKPFVGDIDGDQRADMVVWRASNGTWYYKLSSANFIGYTAVQWGLPGDIPVLADYDGDKRADLTVFRPHQGLFFSLLSSSGYNQNGAVNGNQNTMIMMPLAGPNYDIVVGDFTGNGKDDFTAVWQPLRLWTAKDSTGNQIVNNLWGYPGDTPLGCDWDNDKTDDKVIVRVAPNGAMNWFVDGSAGVYVTKFGSIGDTPQCNKDFDGDGETDHNVFRNGNGNWYIMQSSNGQIMNKQFGLPGDIAL